MRPQAQFALAVAVLSGFVICVVAGGAALAWAELNSDERELLARALEARVGLVALGAIILVGGLAAMLNWAFKRYVAPPRMLAEQVTVMTGANPGHRIAPQGATEIARLVAAINAFADAHQALAADVAEKIRSANASLEEEKNRLAALMSELSQAVLVCNSEGMILLYNARARALLERHAASPVGGAIVGLGRSIFAAIERNLIDHALATIHHRLVQGDARCSASFVSTTADGNLMRVQMAPVLDASKDVTGFVLTLENITRAIETDTRRDRLLQSLTEGTRAALASIRAAVETMLAYPGMDAARRANFTRIISQESEQLSARLDTTMHEYADDLKSQWPLEEIIAGDLVAALCRRIEALGLACSVDHVDKDLWLRVDGPSLVPALAHLASRVRAAQGIGAASFSVARSGRVAQLDMIWAGPSLPPDTLNAWESEPLQSGGVAAPMTLREVAARHGGEGWYQSDESSGRALYRLLLPLAPTVREAASETHTASRPEYYDFDLFNQLGQNTELDQRTLTSLAYTVFDTETTGLNPAEGDEIIAIGAVRIVNMRLLAHEIFDKLVDPCRPVSAESARIHGITDDMLVGQPTLERVLPAFHRFAEDSVLVGHNVAFDMRFLQLKEVATQVRFVQPVLDTLHSLEAIAARLGITLTGRHNALGDSLVTGEVFLRMIPLLVERGIHTLREAREAAQKTRFARVRY